MATDSRPASDQSIDTSDSVVSVDTTNLASESTAKAISGPAAQSMEEPTLRKLGRFELKSVLGAGGFGKVYRAYDPQLERFVALKVPTFGPNQKTRIQRFLSEAKAAARLKHANIVSTFESGKADKKYYIASEYIEGELLSRRIKKSPLTTRQSVELVQKLADALAYAHSQNIVHRDIKPHNVMVDDNGEPQLMDFGLAKRLDDDSNVTTDGALLGTPAYMSPEQARGELHLITGASDQYSLGVVLFHLLTGKTPCEGSPHLVIAEVARGEHHSPRDINPEIDSDLDAICRKAMNPDASGRYDSCEDFAQDLGAWIAGNAIVARPLSTVGRSIRVLRRNGLIASLFAIIIALAVALAVFGWQTLNPPQLMTAPSTEETEPTTSNPTGTPIRNHVTSDNVSVPEEAEGLEVVDLLDLIRIRDCQVTGEWTQQPFLESPHLHNSLLQIPYIPPEEFDLEIVLEPLEPIGHGIAIGVGQMECVLASKYPDWNASKQGNKYYFDNPIDPGNETTRFEADDLLLPDRKSTVLIRARKTSLSLQIDGRSVLTLQEGRSAFHLKGWGWRPIPNALFLGPNLTKCRFHSAILIPHKGSGKFLLPPNLITESAITTARNIFGPAILDVREIADRIDGRLRAETDEDGNQYLLFAAQKTGAKWKQLTTEDFRLIAGLTGPVRLNLSWTRRLPLEGFTALAEMKQLEGVEFWGNSDLTYEMFLQLPPEQLRSIGLRSAKVTDAIAAHLAKMKNLEHADVHVTRVGDETLAVLGELPRLKRVVIGSPDITDDGLQKLCSNKSIEVLQIWPEGSKPSVKITSASLDAIKTLPKLTKLEIHRTSIDRASVDAFRKAHGHVTVDFKPPEKPAPKAVTAKPAAKPLAILQPAANLPNDESDTHVRLGPHAISRSNFDLLTAGEVENVISKTWKLCHTTDWAIRTSKEQMQTYQSETLPKVLAATHQFYDKQEIQEGDQQLNLILQALGADGTHGVTMDSDILSRIEVVLQKRIDLGTAFDAGELPREESASQQGKTLERKPQAIASFRIANAVKIPGTINKRPKYPRNVKQQVDQQIQKLTTALEQQKPKDALIVVGKVNVEDVADVDVPQHLAMQCEVLNDGYFVTALADRQKPLVLVANGFSPVELMLPADAEDKPDAELHLEPIALPILPDSDQEAIAGVLKLEPHASPDLVTVSATPRVELFSNSPFPNDESSIPLSNSRLQPTRVPIRNRQHFSIKGTPPVPHSIRIERAGYEPTTVEYAGPTFPVKAVTLRALNPVPQNFTVEDLSSFPDDPVTDSILEIQKAVEDSRTQGQAKKMVAGRIILNGDIRHPGVPWSVDVRSRLSARTYLNADGWFSSEAFRHFDEDDVYVRVRILGHSPVDHLIPYDDKDIHRLKIVVNPTPADELSDLQVQVVDNHDKPLPNADLSVGFYGTNSTREFQTKSFMDGDLKRRSDKSGIVTIPQLASAWYTIAGTAKDHRKGSTSVFVPAATDTEVKLVLARPRIVHLEYVTQPNGSGVFNGRTQKMTLVEGKPFTFPRATADGRPDSGYLSVNSRTGSPPSFSVDVADGAWIADVGDKDLKDIQTADGLKPTKRSGPNGIVIRPGEYARCRLNHVYVIQTADNKHLKFRVRKIEQP